MLTLWFLCAFSKTLFTFFTSVYFWSTNKPFQHISSTTPLQPMCLFVSEQFRSDTKSKQTQQTDVWNHSDSEACLVCSSFCHPFCIIYTYSYYTLWSNLNLSWSQLLETKSTDRKQTLLHYIANVVREKYAAVSMFYNELHYVEKAAAGKTLFIVTKKSSLIQMYHYYRWIYIYIRLFDLSISFHGWEYWQF